MIRKLKSPLLILVCIILITSDINALAMEDMSRNTASYQPLTGGGSSYEDVKVVDSIEELDTHDTIVASADSIYRSRRLIITSPMDMQFKDEEHRDNIKSVQRYDDYYIVEYATTIDAERAYEYYIASGIDVEIDIVGDSADPGIHLSIESDESMNEEVSPTDDTSVVVAILDSGMNDCGDIYDNRVISGKNFVDDSGDTIDRYGHGTIISRIILGLDDTSNVKVMPVKILNDEGLGTTLSAYKGIKYAIDCHVDIINLSLSGVGHSKLLSAAINEAYDNNIPVVVASGNDNRDITDYTPANIERAITVGSADMTVSDDGDISLIRAPYSNYSGESAKIDYVACGTYSYYDEEIDELAREAEASDYASEVFAQCVSNGTSISVAYVSSFIAKLILMASGEDRLTMRDIIKSLDESAICSDNETYYGRGYLAADNIRLVRADTGSRIDIIDSEDVGYEDSADDEGITLRATAGSYAIGIKRGFSGFDANGNRKELDSSRYVVFDYNGFIGNYRADFATPTEAWRGALLCINMYARDRIAEIHLYCDLEGINWSGALTSLNSSFPAWSSNWEFYLLSDTAMNGTRYTVSINSASGTLFTASGVHLHNVVVEDRRSGNKDIAIAMPVHNLDVQDSYISVCNGKANGVMQLYQTGISNVDIKNSVIDSCLRCDYALRLKSGWGGTIRNSELRSSLKYGVYNESPTTVTFDGCDLHSNTSSNYYNTSNGQLRITGGSSAIYASRYGIDNPNGLVTLTGGRIYNNSYSGINNRGSVTYSGASTYSNVYGIQNNGNLIIEGGAIYNNSSYGVDNYGMVTHSGGGIYSNRGSKPTAYDTDYVGVYQSGTYTISASAGIYSNSLYLPSKSARLKQSGHFTGSASLTTGIDDRTVGRELVTGSSAAYTSKYSLAYGAFASINKAHSVKDSSGESFTGREVGIRPGSYNNQVSTSQYLSGKYAVSYDLDKSKYPGLNPNKSYSDTLFWWREEAVGLFGDNKPIDYEESYEFIEWNELSGGGGQGYKSNYTFKKGTLSGNKTYYALWEKVNKAKYNVRYIYNNGYNDEETVTCNRDKYYTYHSKPNRYKSALITFVPGLGSDITNLSGAAFTGTANRFNAAKTFNGWQQDGYSMLRAPGELFINLGIEDTTVTMLGKWTISRIVLPDTTNDDYELIGWQIGGEGTIYPAGTNYTPSDDNPIEFVAVWKKIDRKITYDPNGAVKSDGTPVEATTVDMITGLSTPISLPGGETAGGKRMAIDTTYIQGFVRDDLAVNIPSDVSKAAQYKVKAGDIVNSLGNTDRIYKFTGWSISKKHLMPLNGDIVLRDVWGSKTRSMNNYVFYALWDEFPVITTGDITIKGDYVPTREELIQAARGVDREDGDITSRIVIINYNEVIAAIGSSNSATIIYEVTDDAGSTTRAFAQLIRADDYDGSALNVIPYLVRTINRHAYATCDEALGGCLFNSPWYEEREYIETMTGGFDNLDNNTPIASYYLSEDDREDISSHMHTVGLERMYRSDVLNYYVLGYMDDLHKNNNNEFTDSSIFGYTITGDMMRQSYIRELDRLSKKRG